MTRSSSLGLWVYGALIFIGSNSLCVTHWKLDKDNNKVVPIETKHTPKHLAAGGSLVDDTRDDNTDIISTLKQRYGRDSASVDTSHIPNVDKKCNVFPCDKLDEMEEEEEIRRDEKEDHQGSDRTLSRSDNYEYSDTENILEQPEEKKVPKRPQPKGFE